MSEFFQLPDDVLQEIYKRLPPHDLLAIAATGEKPQKIRREALKALFLQRTGEAITYQQKMFEYWLHQPNPLMPSKDVLLPALKHLDVFHQIIGLGLINSTENTAWQALQHYLSYLIEKIRPETEDIHDLLHLLHIAHLLNDHNIEQALPLLQNNLSNENFLIRNTTLNIITALSPRLKPEQITPFFPELLKILKSPKLVGHHYTNTFKALANRADAEQLNLLIPELQECLYQENGVDSLTLTTIGALADTFNPAQLALFLDRAQNNLKKILDRLEAPLNNNEQNKESTEAAAEFSQTCKIALYTFKSLASKLNSTQLEQLLPILIKYLNYPKVIYFTVPTLEAIASHSAHPALLLERLQENIQNPEFLAKPRIQKTLQILTTRLQPKPPIPKVGSIAPANKLNPVSINAQIPIWIENLNSGDARTVLGVLRSLEAHKNSLTAKQLGLFLPELHKKLKHPSFMVSATVLVIINSLSYKFEQEQLIPLIPEVLENLHTEIDDVPEAAASTLVFWGNQPQKKLAKEILNQLINTLHESKEESKIEKLWDTLLAIDKEQNNFRTSTILDYIESGDIHYLFTQLTTGIYNNNFLTKDELSLQYFLLHLLERLDESEQTKAVDKLLLIICNNEIEPELRDITLQTLSSWIMTLIHTQQQGLINTISHNIDEMALKTNDEYSILLLAVKSQIPQAPIAIPKTTGPK